MVGELADSYWEWGGAKGQKRRRTMKHKKIIMLLGIISMILLIVQSANAAFLAYTKAGYPACASLLDFNDVSTCFLQRDSAAVNKIVEQCHCIILKPDLKVWAWRPEWAEEYAVQIVCLDRRSLVDILVGARECRKS